MTANHTDQNAPSPAGAGKGAPEAPVGLSARAARRVAELIRQQGKPGLMLRVKVDGGGCSGFQYGFDFDTEAAEDDIKVERDGVTMLVDSMSLLYLSGAEVDYVEDLVGASFQVTNPNAASSCGCGSSFSI
ncbi:iron-sulfur cluster insertion protein ErpA [Yunchengibacter salinarum]|uniref:iron-sulfur cluster insertion protein ErpA n=1 Tax=Yunchengibacter salinarum TaxID=3133399 RepID=UPI0035B68CA2